MMVYSGNFHLTTKQMLVNAQYVLNYLLEKGWTKNAICGMLGNMQNESGVNPGIWQSLDEGNLNGGFGLVQWTPASKYIDWANNNGFVPASMNGNLQRILYEVVNNLQWINSRDPKHRSFAEFTQSTDSSYSLGRAFVTAYERPADQSEANLNYRGNCARNMFIALTGGVNDGGTELPSLIPKTGSSNALIQMLLCDVLNGLK